MAPARVPAVTLSRAVTRTGVVADSLCHGSVASHHISSRVTCHVSRVHRAAARQRLGAGWAAQLRCCWGPQHTTAPQHHNTTPQHHNTQHSTALSAWAQHSTALM